MRKKYKIIGALGCCLILLSNISYGKNNIKQWNTGIITGPISNNGSWRYYIEPQLRLIGDQYVFNQAFFLIGIGYRFTPTLTFYAGPGDIYTLSTAGTSYNVFRTFQQLDWQAIKNSALWITSRTRLQEDQRTNDTPGTLTVLRQRYWFRIPIHNTNQYYYSFFDEIFFNLNQTDWSSQTSIQQNRVFIGIGKQISKKTTLDFGYLNQEEFGIYSQINSVIMLSFTSSF